MYQLVNLYQPVFRQQPKILSALTIAIILAVVIVFMMAFYAQAHLSLRDLRRTSADLTLNHTQIGARLGAAMPLQTEPPDESLQDQLVFLKKRIDDEKALLARIDELYLESETGYADVFETLARVNVPGLWLTDIRRDSLGNTLVGGTASDPKLVPRYLKLLAQEPALTGLSRGTVSLVRNVPEQPEVDFILRQEPPGAVR